VSDATAAAEARVLALEGRNGRLMASLQAASVTTRTAAVSEQLADGPVRNARRLSDESKKSKSAANRARRDSTSGGTPGSHDRARRNSMSGTPAGSKGSGGSVARSPAGGERTSRKRIPTDSRCLRLIPGVLLF